MSYVRLGETWQEKTSIENYEYVPEKTRVFLIGFNKTGTSSFHYLFEDSGYKSEHFKYNCKEKDRRKCVGPTLVEIMNRNIANNNKLLYGVNADIISDVTSNLGGNGEPRYDFMDYYKILDLQYPKSKFILNVRTLHKWIKSRMNHPVEESALLEQAKTYLNTEDIEEIKDYWKHQYKFYVKDVEYYFKYRPEDFMMFDIENDDPIKIMEFLKESHPKLDITKWGKKYSTKEWKKKK